jgi:hypothetical protein
MPRTIWLLAGDWPGGYVNSRLAPAQIHTGAVATVQGIRRGRQLVEISYDLVTPSIG